MSQSLLRYPLRFGAVRSNIFRQEYVVPLRFMSTTTSTDEKERIYTGSLAGKMKAVKFFSLTTSLTGCLVQPTLLEESMKFGGTGMAVVACGVAGFFTVVTPLLLHFITKKYITELFYDKKTEEYTAVTISLFLMRKEIKFKPADVIVPDVPGMFSSFKVGKKSLFLEPSLFSDPEHYIKIMGYDKPVDLKLNMTETIRLSQDNKPKEN